MTFQNALANVVSNAQTLRDAARTKDAKVLSSLLGPALRGFVLQSARGATQTTLPVAGTAQFRWKYEEDQPDFRKLYRAAKRSQWDAESALDWSIEVDPFDPERPLLADEWVPFEQLGAWKKMTSREKVEHVRDYIAWVLSQFLHGEQGALFAACEVTQAVPWYEGKLYGATQVVDEARHLEVFHRYLSTKLERHYAIDDNLYVVIDAIVSDPRFDVKFLGMQIMVEGLALGAFGTYRSTTREPLLKELLKLVITDEARHVHYGVLALAEHVKTLSASERKEREDYAFELALLMRNRFLAHEFFEEHFAHVMSRREWDRFALTAPLMQHFRRTMFQRIVPNLKRIGLLSDRVRPYYAELGLLEFEHGKAAPELTAGDLLAGT